MKEKEIIYMTNKNYVIIDNRTRKEKFDDFKFKVKSKVRNLSDWLKQNPEVLVVLIPVVTKGSIFLVKTISKNVTLNKQKNLKELYCYDRSLGHYWKLRRELSNQEWVEIDRRKRTGEKLSDILESLKVLA